MTQQAMIVKQQSRLPALVELFQRNGIPILFESGQEDDAQISLTGLWRANGAKANKKPTDWMRSSDCSDFISAFMELAPKRKNSASAKESVSRAKEEDLIRIRRGGNLKGGETFAHNEIALEYARYLSPSLRIEMNRHFKQSLEKESIEKKVEQMFREKVRDKYIHSKALSWENHFSKRLLKRFAVLKGRPEWYDETNGHMCVALSQVLCQVFSDRLPDVVMREVRASNPRKPSGGRRYRIHQLLKGSVRNKWDKMREDAERYAFNYDSFEEFIAVWDHVWENPNVENEEQLQLFQLRVQLIPSQFAQAAQ